VHVLVTGASGFLGRHLCAELVQRGHTVEGWSRSRRGDAVAYEQREVDLLDPASCASLHARFDAAFHLAGHTVPRAPWDERAVLENVRMCAQLVQHLERTSPGARLVFLSSAHVYAPSERAHVESDELDPRSPYGLSKLLCETWLRAHRAELHVVSVRSFSQIGPGMAAGLLLPDFLAMLASDAPTLQMRGQDALRDFLDVRDGVRAVSELLELDGPSGAVFNLCSARPVAVSELVHGLAERLGERRAIAFAPGRGPSALGANDALVRATRWQPRHALAETIAWIADSARSRGR
jgi:nucleoside-diphosphate-sugar epimerase